jgi:hypothetical protein
MILQTELTVGKFAALLLYESLQKRSGNRLKANGSAAFMLLL